MKASLHRIGTRLYAEPWLIESSKYASILDQFRLAVQARDHGVDLSVATPRGNPKHLEDVEISNGIALVRCFGIIGKNLSMLDLFCGGFDLSVLNSQLISLMHRPDVRTVMLHFDTPGGAAAGVADSAQVLMQLSETKRVVSYVDQACSGGQWLASATQHTYIGESAMAGSISAVCAITDQSKMYEDEGLAIEVFTDGRLKGIGIPGTTLTQEQRDELQRRVEYIGGEFKSFIKTRRPRVKDEDMQGQSFYGLEAIRNGLADQIVPSIEYAIAEELARFDTF